MTEAIICCNCDNDCTRHHWMCDEPDQDGAWCPACWENTACCAGVHGEGCATQVFSSDAGEREYDPNVAPCDDAEFGMKP